MRGVECGLGVPLLASEVRWYARHALSQIVTRTQPGQLPNLHSATRPLDYTSHALTSDHGFHQFKFYIPPLLSPPLLPLSLHPCLPRCQALEQGYVRVSSSLTVPSFKKILTSERAMAGLSL